MLRARIVGQNEAFDGEMRTIGQTYDLVDSACNLNLKYDRSAKTGTLHLPQKMSRAEFISKHVAPLLHQKRGLELPGESNPVLIYDLFHLFSTNWKPLAEAHIRKVHSICVDFVGRVIEEKWPEGMRQQIKGEKDYHRQLQVFANI
jgi:hypothetical protein